MDVSTKKRTLLKVIVLGDSGYGSKFLFYFFSLFFSSFCLDDLSTFSSLYT